MAEIVASSFLAVIFEKLASVALETLAPYVEMNSEIKKLERSLFQIRNVLIDASQKEITDQSVKQWLNALLHLAYDIDDVLDEIATEAKMRQLNDESETHTSKVRKFFPNPFSKHSSWNRTMNVKINVVTTKLQELLKEKDALGLVVKEEANTRSRNINRRLQTSLVHASSIIGRQVEKEALLNKLLQDEPCDRNFSIIPIVGMGGVGKTTLARLLYDEQQVKDHFELNAWVCVSDEFDSFRISEVIFQSLTGVKNKFADLNLLQVALRNHLREKRFLLVLDDVWSESCEDWETLIMPFYACAPGSKIIMTTRKDKLLRMLGYSSDLNHLQSLSHDDALSLLALRALGVNNFDSHLSLKSHGIGIVKKCDGLPLALKAIGRLLGTQKDEEYLKKVLDSEIWRLPIEGEIIPALRLSYRDLSARLKHLFAYCSLFPKNYMFYKEELVQLWMAEGFLHRSTPSDSSNKCLGHEYFNELLSRSFFQHAPNDKSLFVMHDMMSDLATFVAGEFFVRFEKGVRKEALDKYRHLSFGREEYVAYNKLVAIKRAKSLRTFLVMSVGVVSRWQYFYLSNKILVDVILELPSLTSLKYLQIIECPSIDASFPRGFWPPKLRTLRIGKLKKPISEWGTQNFPTSLVALKLYGEDGVSSCTQFSHLLPSSLTSLEISEFDKLELLSMGLQHLTSLQHLSFLKCPNMMVLPEMRLPSLLSFRIINCPNLKERCSEEGCYWTHIYHIPCIEID